MGMDLYYALGGGLGHLTRARAALATLHAQARVLTVSPHAADPMLTRGLDLLQVPDRAAEDPRGFRPWLHGLLWRERPARLYLDCFPAGLFGELCGLPLPPGLELHHLARLLRWDAYARLLQGEAPRMHRIHMLEPLAADHVRWLAAHGLVPETLQLRDPGLTTPAMACERLAALAVPRWLIVHSGPQGEIRELVAYARDMAAMEGEHPRLVLVAPLAMAAAADGCLHIPAYPARGLFPLAQRIITACGFNTMRETESFRAIHRFLPMPRRFDDQHTRAAQRAWGTSRLP